MKTKQQWERRKIHTVKLFIYRLIFRENRSEHLKEIRRTDADIGHQKKKKGLNEIKQRVKKRLERGSISGKTKMQGNVW